MSKRVLITGGAGFIGSHLADDLLRHGYTVRSFDCLDPQVHGDGGRRPSYLSNDVELIVGDLRDPGAVAKALDGVDAVCHLAALVGVGQSMYQVARYTEVNNGGTAVLMEAICERRDRIQRLVVASSMSIYGEGMYRRSDGTLVPGRDRGSVQLATGDWEVRDPETGEPMTPVPTPEEKQPSLASVYALSKYDQEKMCLVLGQAYNIPTVALRFFNVFGTRQALSNPYTGVLAIFASRYLNRRPPLLFEDGNQRRDFVSVKDIAQACRLSLTVKKEATGQALNVGSGRSYAVREVAEKLAHVMNCSHIEPTVTGEGRRGDIRHCFADITLARTVLGYEPQVPLEDGLEELAEWLEGQVVVDRVDEARAELAARGLVVA